MKARERILAIARNYNPTRLGHIDCAVFIRDTACVFAQSREMRVLYSYAICYILKGEGRFRDIRGVDCAVSAGDLLLFFPGVAHQYGPAANQGLWDELLIFFRGPVFDLWRDQKFLDPTRPVIRLQPLDYWAAHLVAAVAGPTASSFADIYKNASEVNPLFFEPIPYKESGFVDSSTSAGEAAHNHLVQICRLQNVLADILEHERQESSPSMSREDSQWLETARAAIDQFPLVEVIDWQALSRKLRMSYVGFRKRFTRLSGTPPAQYRARRIIEWSCGRLDQKKVLVRTIAEECGFYDEYHFSKRFKQIMGISPTNFRHRHERGAFGGRLNIRSNHLPFREY
jgi:AraC-like DNA-binding protein